MAKQVHLPNGLKPPRALVKKPRLFRHGGIEQGLREGRGFSIGELRKAGLAPKNAMKLGIHVDKRRRSVHEWNVEALRKFVEDVKKAGINI